MPLKELAHLMIQLGCTDAVNLDGGGSSTMVLGNTVVNHVSDDTDELNRKAEVDRTVTMRLSSRKGSINEWATNTHWN